MGEISFWSASSIACMFIVSNTHTHTVRRTDEDAGPDIRWWERGRSTEEGGRDGDFQEDLAKCACVFFSSFGLTKCVFTVEYYQSSAHLSLVASIFQRAGFPRLSRPHSPHPTALLSNKARMEGQSPIHGSCLLLLHKHSTFCG